MLEDNGKSWEIKLFDLTLGYEQRVVLDKINAFIPGGKISMILGSSGCGKSTLLRHLVGLRRPMSGKIILDKYDLFALPEKTFRAFRRRMGMLFQDGALLGSMNLFDNVALPLHEHTSLPEGVIRETTMHNLDLVGLADAAGYFPNELSGGMRKRAGLARAMITSPPILLCDEPTSGLDPINAAQMDALLLNLKAQNPQMTLVVVSHDIESLFHIAEHVMILHDGGIAFNGPLDELKKTENFFLKRFLDRGLHKELEKDMGRRFVLRPQVRQEVKKALSEWLGRS